MATATATAPGPRVRARRWFAGFASRDTWAAYAFLSPWLFGFVVFTAGPMIASLIISFTDYSVIQTTHNVGLANYHTLVHDPYVRTALRNTFVFTLLSVPAHVIIALGLAAVLARVGRAAGIFRTIFYLPVMTPGVAIGILYLLIFNGSYGVLNKGLGYIGITGPFWTTDPNWVKPGLALMISVWAVGASVVIFLAALVGVPRHLYEAAEMDGASSWRRFRDVTLPMISPSIFFVVVINTISGLQTFDQVYTAFFNQSTPYGTNASLMYAIYIFQQAFTFFKFGYASALAWILFAIIGAITAIQIVVSRRFVYYEGDRS
ncbi:MAG: multiple sugar transport system permease protein [Gaiellaceae bacterium]|jgi:multiple sugar transport system permease protein|nr:multiple sugar transport system permease protein [Gaiellaceae bacterium]